MKKLLVLMGDSLTFGYGNPKKDTWAYKLSKEIDIEVINKGINGDITPSMLSRFYRDVSSLSPSKVFIMGGTNDLLSGRSVKSIIDNIELMIKESINSHIIIGIPPYIKKEMAEKLFSPSNFYDYCINNLPLLRDELINLCNKYSINYVDLYSLTIKNIDKDIYIDGIHLNSKGNDLILNAILKLI